MSLKKNKFLFFKGNLSIIVIFLFLGVLFFCLAATGYAQEKTVVAQASPIFNPAPVNPDFSKYMMDFKAGKVQKITADGHGLGYIPAPLDLPDTGKKLAQFTSFPVAYDLRTRGKLTPVKNQGSCGSCWAFATYSSLESYLLPGETTDFSENHLKNTHGFDWGPCQGGNQFISAAYLARWSGPVDEAGDPYSPYDGTSPEGLSPQKHLQQAYFVPDRTGPLDNSSIKQAVMNYGAVFTSMYYGSSYYNSTNHTYYYNGSTYSNHAVAIVGWDDSFDRNKFNTPPPGDGAFIIKNSWGTGWGDNGYFYISYYDSNIGKDNVVYTAEPATNYKGVYQYDPYGWVDSVGAGSPTLWFANIFTARSDEKLAAVSLYSATPDSAYELYIYTGVDTQPRSGTLAGTKTGTLPLPGYNTIKLDAPVALTAGQKFSVVIRLTTPGYNYPCPVEYAMLGYDSKAASNPGESWVSKDGLNWDDLHGVGYGNACLKAFTIGANDPTLTIISPNGGENWAAGTSQIIQWRYTGNPGSEVKIELLKGGILDRIISPGTSIGSNGSGSFTWSIPENQVSGSNYRIKITSSTSSSFTSTSVGMFTITGPGITITSPNGWERWSTESTQNICWNYTGNPGPKVKIELLKDDTVNSIITTSTPIGAGGSGFFTWSIPENQSLGNDYKIKITSTANSNYTDTSDNNFTIKRATDKNILFIQDSAEINDINNSTEYGYSILKSTLENELDYTVTQLNPYSITPSLLSNYDIVVFAPMFRAREISSDEANALVSFVNKGGTLFLVGEWGNYPKWNNSFNKVGNLFGITADYNQISDPTDYYQYDIWPVIKNTQSHPVMEGVNQFILPSAGTLTVTSPAIATAFTDQDATPAGQAVLAAVKTAYGKVVAISDSSFLQNKFITMYDNHILATNIFTWLAGDTEPAGATITMTSPNGGENWVAGSTHSITWNYTGDPGAQVKIELLKGGAADYVISPGTPVGTEGAGSYSWTIPESQASGSNYTVKVTSTSYSSCTDTSDGCFSITAPSNTVVGFDPSETTVYKNPNEDYSPEFVVSVTIDGLADGQKVLSFHDTIKFDPALLEAVKVEIPTGSLLEPVLFWDHQIDNQHGIIEFALARENVNYPGSGGMVYNITLRAKNEGTTSLDHLAPELRNDRNLPVQVGTSGCTVNVTSLVGDFDADGNIDSTDKEVFSLSWKHKAGDTGWDEKVPNVPGTPYRRADIGPATGAPPGLVIQPDGMVDFEDLSVFALMWNWYKGYLTRDKDQIKFFEAAGLNHRRFLIPGK